MVEGFVQIVVCFYQSLSKQMLAPNKIFMTISSTSSVYMACQMKVP